MRFACKVGLLLALVLAQVGVGAMAQSYPSRPIRFMVGFPPGGSNDILARIVSPKLGERLGQPVLVDNKPGADSMIAGEYVAKSAPDGYTLLVTSIGGMVFSPVMYERPLYDPLKDFIPVTLFATDPLVFAVNPSVKATTIKEIIELAKGNPGKIFYGAGSPPMHVAAEMFKKQVGVNIVHVPYKGTGASLTATISGEVSLVVSTVGPALAQLRAGKLRPLAVTSLKRDPLLPDVPTVSESGLDFEIVAWTGLFAPAGTPSAVIDKLFGELSIVLKMDSVKDRIAALGYDTSEMGIPPAQFASFMRASIGKWAKVTKDLNIRAK
ncbi:MAG: tripartite tricarboxylate transporter substrate binding protein [Betaproteobacteria bacterium]|nr:tripartite tricarboxylate transporter substrate binding protein [Betaproteobacteria bacterium]